MNKQTNKTMKFSTKYIAAESDAANEHNDCVVRAFTMAMQIPYFDAHKFVKTKFHRVDRRGTYTMRHMPEVQKQVQNGYKIEQIRFTERTVGSFLKNHPKGQYFLLVRSHAVGICDGQTSDPYLRKGQRLRHVFEMVATTKKGNVKTTKIDPWTSTMTLEDINYWLKVYRAKRRQLAKADPHDMLEHTVKQVNRLRRARRAAMK